MNIIRRCFNSHVKDCGGEVEFTFDQYNRFWVRHHPGDVYKMKNRDGSFVNCKVAYFPLPSTYANGILKQYKDLRALIEIPIPGGTDFREVPVVFLQKELNITEEVRKYFC